MDGRLIPATAREAKLAGETYYFTGKPCKRGHTSKRFATNKACTECLLSHNKGWRKRNLDATREYAKARRHANPMPNRARVRAWQQANPERHAALLAERCARRRKRTPPWADRVAMRCFYEIAARVSRCTGIKFEVDHIEPLCGKDFSGLHVPWNLRVIPAQANRRKNNRRDGEW